MYKANFGTKTPASNSIYWESQYCQSFRLFSKMGWNIIGFIGNIMKIKVLGEVKEEFIFI